MVLTIKICLFGKASAFWNINFAKEFLSLVFMTNLCRPCFQLLYVYTWEEAGKTIKIYLIR